LTNYFERNKLTHFLINNCYIFYFRQCF